MYGVTSDTAVNLFPKETRPYYILAPSYTHTSSGVRTLHLLCHALNSVGHKAFLVANSDDYRINANLNTPVLTVGTSHLDAVFVYPDITNGNPWVGRMEPKRVVRYLLAPPLYPKSFGEKDQIWGYTTPLAKSFGSDKVLTVPTFNRNIFYPPMVGSVRSGSCFYSHKYDKIFGHKLLPVTDDMTRVEGTAHEVANILHTHEICYVYERSEIIINAALCGCKVHLVKTDYFNCLDDDELFPQGLPPEDVMTIVRDIENKFPQQLREFIDQTQNG